MNNSQDTKNSQPEQERCVGCEACIDTACGRDECPKGWPKAAQPEQEPVAFDVWLQECQSMTVAVRHGVKFLIMPEESAVRIGNAIQNTTPPQRTWVELTKEDMDWLHENTPCIEGNYGYRFIKYIEAKIKEKNT